MYFKNVPSNFSSAYTKACIRKTDKIRMKFINTIKKDR